MKCTRICLRMSRDTQADYKSMKPYIDITEDAKKEASRRWKKCGMPNSSTLKKSAKKRK